jgi:hypothetical protein
VKEGEDKLNKGGIGEEKRKEAPDKALQFSRLLSSKIQ